MTSGDSTRLADETADFATPAAPAASEENETPSPSADSDREPWSSPVQATEPAQTETSAPESPPSRTRYAAPPPSYSRSEWSTTADATPSSGSTTTSAWASAAEATRSPRQAPAPAADGGAPSPFGNGYSSSNRPPSGVASGVGRQAAGFAGSVASAWQKRGSTRGTQARRPAKRQAMLTLARVEPWSVMKFSFVASVVAFIILFVAVAVLYMVLSALGVFDSLQNTVSSITSSQNNSGTNIAQWFSASRILGYTAMLGALNIVLITAMSTVGSVIYNLIAKTIGGIEVTLRETD
jgi:hypothetical protein